MTDDELKTSVDADTYDERVALTLKKARRISRSQLKAFAMRMVKDQDGVCPLCGTELTFDVGGHKSNVVVEHDHVSGLVKSALCRGCNGASGKAQHAIASWGKVGKSNIADQAKYLHKVADQLMKTPYAIIYSDHKTDEEVDELKNKKKVKARQAAARQAALLKLKEVKE